MALHWVQHPPEASRFQWISIQTVVNFSILVPIKLVYVQHGHSQCILTKNLGFRFFENNFAYIWLNSCDFVGMSGQVICLWCVSCVIHDENHSPEPPPEPQASTRITKVNILCQQVLKHPLIINCSKCVLN